MQKDKRLMRAVAELKQRIIFAKMKDEAARAAREFVFETCADILGVTTAEIVSDDGIYAAVRAAIRGEIPISDAARTVEERAREARSVLSDNG